jgi:hypothetical protein
MGEARSAHKRNRDVCKILAGKREEERPLRRRRGRWDDNGKMDLKEVGREDVDWFHLA